MNSIREANCGLYYTSYVENEKRHFAIYKHNVTDEISMEQCFSLFLNSNIIYSPNSYFKKI